jgi:hypothetical protein
VAPLVAMVASVFIAMASAERPSMASVVACSPNACTLYRLDGPGKETAIPCEDVDDIVQRLTAPRPALWHRTSLYELRNPEMSVSVERARELLAGCLDRRLPGAVALYVT